MEDKTDKHKCDDCGKLFSFGDGILAEVKNNKVVVTNCSAFTSLTCLCNDCVKKRNIIVDE